MSADKNWYVVYTRPRWEKKIAGVLADKDIEHYCPLNKVTRQWSDRRKTVLEPLFKGYIFICTEELKKWDVRKIDGILNYVHWLGKPAIVRSSEIETIRKFLQEFDDVEVTEQYPSKNDEVKIKQGIMMDYKGIILELAGSKARVMINSMGVVLEAVFERKNLVKI